MNAVSELIGRLRRRGGTVGARDRRGRVALAGVVAVCVTVTGFAVTGAGTAPAGMKFVQSGHLIYNSTLRTVFHLDGGTKNIDGRVPVPGAAPGSQVVQTDKSGFVLAENGTIEFGKSDLQVADPLPVPAAGRPVGLEAAGAAYAVYRQAGKIQRFGEKPAAASIDGVLGQPVVTSTGTLWVNRVATGEICRLPLQADRLACGAKLAAGHTGVLTLVGDQPVVVDLTAKELRAVDDDGLGRAATFAQLDVSPATLVAPNDLSGRVAMINPDKGLLQLVDAASLTSGRTPAPPVVKKLRPGKYEQLASSGDGLALIDTTTDTLMTLDRNGDERALRRIPPPSAQAKTGPEDRSVLFRGGDSRLYVDSRAGEHVMVVDLDGEVTDVDVSGQVDKRGGRVTPKPVEPPKSTPPPVEPPPSTPSGRPSSKPTEPPASTEPPEQGLPEQPTDPATESTERPSAPTTKNPPPTKNPRQTKPSVPAAKPSTPPPTKPPVKPSTPPTQPPTTKPPAKPSTPPPTVPPPTKPPVVAGKPGAPGGVTGRAGDGSAVVSWTAAAPNGAAITSYVVSWPGSSLTTSGSTRTATVTGLTNGQSYVFTVRAVNSAGSGAGASTARITLAAAPGQPAGLTATATPGAVSLAWNRPALNGGTLLHYTVTQGGTVRQTSSTSYQWTGLTNGRSYTFEVRAVTRTPDGRQLTSAAATRSATPPAPKPPPATLQISHGDSTDKTDSNCPKGESGCAYIHLRARNLQPNTTYTFRAYASGRGEMHKGGYQLRSDADGTIEMDKFHNSAVGQEIHVTMDGPGGLVTSNYLTWPDS
ncbi:fibronectin type III domain-containing protein [Kribbella sp. NPDC056861]|uniref:fibronectin type III domain-containing protein n=1 Tax=Kribbella sp. NPDC056861 TaxID=3154857 RepID=UPI00343B92FF